MFEICKDLEICTSYHDEESKWKGREKRKRVESKQRWAPEEIQFWQYALYNVLRNGW